MDPFLLLLLLFGDAFLLSFLTFLSLIISFAGVILCCLQIARFDGHPSFLKCYNGVSDTALIRNQWAVFVPMLVDVKITPRGLFFGVCSSVFDVYDICGLVINKWRRLRHDLDSFHRVPHKIPTQTLLSESWLRILLLKAAPAFLRLFDYLRWNWLEHLVAELYGTYRAIDLMGFQSESYRLPNIFFVCGTVSTAATKESVQHLLNKHVKEV